MATNELDGKPSYSYGDQLLQAMEIFWSNPADLTRKAQAIIIDWQLLIMTKLSNSSRMRAYYERGITFEQVLSLEGKIREIYRCPTPDNDVEEERAFDSDNEPKPSSYTQGMPGLAKASSFQPRTKISAG
jgi:hypothetical protein